MSRTEPARLQSRNWEETYKELADHELPWFWDELDQDFAKILSRQDTENRRLLDLGTGQGNQAVALAELGYEVLGLDLSKEAIRRAQALAQEAGSPAQFRPFDLLKEDLDEAPFDLITDRGCFHAFNAEGRSLYAQKVKNWLKPDGQILI